jgi:Tol biopolymer transport system component
MERPVTAGETIAPEWKTFQDPISGVKVQQLTNYKGHSHHFYFTNPGWYAGDQKLLFSSDRNNRANLYSIDLNSGQIRYDGSQKEEYDFPHTTGHIHSNDFKLIVGDGGRVVRLWKWNGNGFDGPRILCQHRSSMHIQQTHVHPRFSPDGSYVVFTSDVSGYGNVYKVEVPAFETLPPVED